MLAPEEIFEGKGDIKEERELSRSDRKRRRANKKRRFKSNHPLSCSNIILFEKKEPNLSVWL